MKKIKPLTNHLTQIALIILVSAFLLAGCSTTDAASNNSAPSDHDSSSGASDDYLNDDDSVDDDLDDDFDSETDDYFDDDTEDLADADDNEPEAPVSTDDFYIVATNKSNKEVEEFAALIKKYVNDKDWDALADMCAYPIMIDGNTIADKSAFNAAVTKKEISQDFYDAIKNEPCSSMFSNTDGIAMGSGEIWFADVQNKEGGFEFKIIAFNSL